MTLHAAPVYRPFQVPAVVADLPGDAKMCVVLKSVWTEQLNEFK
jgi:hypothetical protein